MRLRTMDNWGRATSLARLALLLGSLVSAAPASAGIVHGKITDAKGDGVRGAHVRLMDRDLGRDDFMGEAFTDAEGVYRIPYEGERSWDAPFGSKPDPYIVVKISAVGASDAQPDDSDALVWRSNRMTNVDPEGTKVVTLQAKQFCRKRLFGCTGACSGGCGGFVVLGVGSCGPCSKISGIQVGTTGSDEGPPLASAMCVESETIVGLR